MISALFHALILFIFTFTSVNHGKERVFNVELVFQAAENKTVFNTNAKSAALRNSAISKKTQTVKHARIKHAFADQTSMPAALNIVTAITERDNSIGMAKKSSGNFSDEDVLTASNSHRREAVDGEFGSINGPFFLKMVSPEYPRLARRLGKEGKVILRLFIAENGQLISIELIERAGYGFDEAAIEALKASSFLPAKINGHPVACKALLPVRFKLE
jgi:protein TonB